VEHYLLEFFSNGHEYLASEVMCSDLSLVVDQYEKPVSVLFLMAKYHRSLLPVTDREERVQGAISAAALLYFFDISQTPGEECLGDLNFKCFCSLFNYFMAVLIRIYVH
jgi:predicted transcriptional regulator